MPSQRVLEQVHGILARGDVRFAVSEDKQSFIVPVPEGSAAVRVDLHPWGRRQTMISLAAEILVDVEVTSENRLEILEHLNALNQSSLFGRFFLDADRSTISLRYELLGDDLDATELTNALTTVGVLADQADDDLLRELGTGRRASDTISLEGSEFSWGDEVQPFVDFRESARRE